jgi:hypothetical protein
VNGAARSDAAAAFEARNTWWSALAATGVVLAAALDRLLSEHDVSRGEAILRIVSIVVLVGLGAVLVGTHKRPSIRLALFAWTIATVAYIVMLPLLGQRYETIGRPWEPLFRQTLAMLVLAAFAPARLLFGVLPIALLLVDSAAEYWLLGLRHSHALWWGTPGRIAFYAAVSLAIVFRRSRALQRERELVEREQEALALERLARVALAVHDVTNNALQTLTASAALLETDATQAQQVAPGMVRAVEKLKTVNDAFGAYQQQVEWRAGDESFDAAAVLAAGGALAKPEDRRPS